MRAGLLALLVVASTACLRSGVLMEEPLRNQIVQAVQQRMRSLEAARTRARCRDAGQSLFHRARVLHLQQWAASHVRRHVDGRSGGAFPTLRSIEGGFEDLDIMVLSPDAVLATAKFQETVTDRNGNQTVQHGAASWLWRQVGGEWRIAYGHVDHYPGKHQRYAAEPLQPTALNGITRRCGTVDPEQCGGRPYMRGMWIRVIDVLDLFAAELNLERSLMTEAPSSSMAQDLSLLSRHSYHDAVTPYNVRYQRLNSYQPSRRDYDWPLVPDRICGPFERYNSCSS